MDCQGAQLVCEGVASVDVWIAEDGIVRRIALEDDSSAFTFEFFDFGAEVDIEPPPPDEVLQEDDVASGGMTVEPADPCAEKQAEPISDDRARAALRRHGFSISSGVGCGALTNSTGGNGQDVLVNEGIVFCIVQRRPPDGAPTTVVRRAVDGADAELVLQNLECTVFTDSPTGEEKIDKLEAAFGELQRVIRP